MKKTFTKVASVLFVAMLAIWTSNAVAQDGCANALPIACGDQVFGTTVGLSPSDGPFCGTAPGTGGSAWYAFTGTGDLVTASLCGGGTTYDSKLNVYTGACGAYVCETGIDDFCGLQSEVTWASVAGTVYYINVNGFGAAEGAYQLDVTCAAAVAGCTDGATPACNFDPAANVDDGTCEYISCAGCTDGVTPACNFDPAATLDDGTCDYSCYGCLDATACNFSAVATIDDGSCCFDNCVSLVVGGGTFDGEIGWTLTDGTGVVVAAGGAGTFELCLLDGCYIYGMTDSFGDGWNGASYTFSDAGGVILSGDLDTATDGDGVSVGSELLSVGTGCAPGCTDATACNFDAAADFDFGCDFLSCAGCTDPTAANFDPSATIDDGSCVFCAAGEVLAFLDMTDSFGDGWNGATYILTSEDGLTIIAQGDLDNAQIGDGLTAGTDQFCVAPGCYLLTVGGGTFDGEVGYSFSDQLGNNYGSGGAVTAQGIDFGFTGGCPFEGCTAPAAINFDPNAGVDDGTCVFPPANNDVCNAEAITCGLSVAGTTINSSDNEGLIGGGGCSGIDVTSPGVWYVFNAAADEQVILSTCASAGGDTKIHVYAAAPDCNNLVCVGANDDGCPGGSFLSELAFTAQTGNDYYILVSEFGVGVGVDFTLDATCQPCLGVPTNDDCANAIPLPTDGSSISGSICCANPSDAPNFAAGFGTAYDVFYTANSGTFDSFFFDITNDSGSEIGLMIYDGDCNTLVDIAGCLVTGQCAGDVGAFLTLAPNTDYIFSVFTTDPAGCGDYTITVSGVVFGCTDASADNFDPAATDDDGSCVYTNVPANDECANAEVIMCNMSYVGSTGNSTATGAPTLLPCDAAPGAGVWYNFTGTGDLVTLSTCGSVIDSKITVWEAADCAGPFTCVADAQDPLAFASAVDGFEACGFFDQDDAQVEFISVAGANYYVYIAHQDVDGDPLTPDWGAFNLDVTCAPVVLGCTNPVAYNYDPAANIEDGSCDFFSDTCAGGPGTPIQLNMQDSFGDGWNGAIYDITLGDGTPIATGDLDNALYSEDNDNFAGPEFGFDLLCLQDGCYIITLGGGTFDGEISFDIVDELGGVIATGIAGETSFQIGGAVCGCTDPGACNFDPLATDEDGSCEFLSCAGCTDAAACNFDATATIEDGSCCFDNCLTIQMGDTFGDGWNGNVYEIYSIDGTLVASGDLDTAQDGDGTTTGTDVLCLTDDCYYIVVDGGAFQGEVTWTLLGANEGPIFGGAPVLAGDFITFSLGAGACVSGCAEPVACNFDPAVNIPVCEACEYSSCLGCTYPDATNYDMAAGIDDGSCTFDTANPCPEDLNEDCIVNAADLLQFLGAFGTTC
ncbi:MAG: hypothetical protein MK081_02095 [Flavobacteriales bacterium]|nr:hypothetical protein [Flavobacteriales bacterium]